MIDLRSLLPWDREAVIQSVQRTGRLLVVHEAPRTGGIGGELAAEIGECCFEWLDAPVTRLAAADVPVPFHPDLERAVLPSVEAIAERVRALRRY